MAEYIEIILFRISGLRQTGESVESKMQVENLIPVLDVRDVDISVAFYCEVLGFALQDKVEWAGRTEWALLRTGKVQLMLCASDHQGDEDETHVNEGIFFLHLENPDSFILRMRERPLPHQVQPETRLGSKDFYLRDPDGYILWFSYRPPVQAQASEEPKTTQSAAVEAGHRGPEPSRAPGPALSEVKRIDYTPGRIGHRAQRRPAHPS